MLIFVCTINKRNYRRMNTTLLKRSFYFPSARFWILAASLLAGKARKSYQFMTSIKTLIWNPSCLAVVDVKVYKSGQCHTMLEILMNSFFFINIHWIFHEPFLCSYFFLLVFDCAQTPKFLHQNLIVFVRQMNYINFSIFISIHFSSTFSHFSLF